MVVHRMGLCYCILISQSLKTLRVYLTSSTPFGLINRVGHFLSSVLSTLDGFIQLALDFQLLTRLDMVRPFLHVLHVTAPVFNGSS